MREKTCCFTGHREISDNENVLKEKIRQTTVSLIQKGVIYFGTGGARGFDTLAAETVLELKEQFPQVRLILILPCHQQTKGWSQQDIKRYDEIRKKADKIKVLSQKYDNKCMYRRNRHMVAHSAFCICYLRRNSGGTAYTLRYAEEKGLKIFLL